MEARVRVDSGEAFMSIENAYSNVDVDMSPSQLQVTYWTSPHSQVNTYAVDMSQFQTIRVAVDTGGDWFLWLDNALLSSGISTSGNVQEESFSFGGNYGSASSSYWDYVAYSKAFLPVPEASSVCRLPVELSEWRALP